MRLHETRIADQQPQFLEVPHHRVRSRRDPGDGHLRGNGGRRTADHAPLPRDHEHHAEQDAQLRLVRETANRDAGQKQPPALERRERQRERQHRDGARLSSSARRSAAGRRRGEHGDYAAHAGEAHRSRARRSTTLNA
jgi:hypothetical protein